MPEETKSWFDLIKYIWNFFFSRRKQKIEEEKEALKKDNEKLQNRYNEIDEKTANKKKDALQDRLNNMF